MDTVVGSVISLSNEGLGQRLMMKEQAKIEELECEVKKLKQDIEELQGKLAGSAERPFVF